MIPTIKKKGCPKIKKEKQNQEKKGGKKANWKGEGKIKEDNLKLKTKPYKYQNQWEKKLRLKTEPREINLVS